MPAPYPRRDPTRGVARAVNRGAKGMAQGRFAGLSTVRPAVVARVQQQPVITVWEQASEPTEAAVHDFWWDTDATP